MTLPEYVQALKRRWWIPAIITSFTVLITGGIVFIAPSAYTATATVFASSPSGSQRSASFEQVGASNSLAGTVIQKAKVSMSIEELRKEIRIGVVGANLYSISVTDQDADRAPRLAGLVATQAVILYRDLAAQPGVSSASEALLKARDHLLQDYSDALTARLKFQAQYPSAFDPKAPIRNVDVAAQAQRLQLQEQAAAAAYRQVLGQISQSGLDQISQARDYTAFVLDQPFTTRSSDSRPLELLFAGAAALLIGLALALLVEYVGGRRLVQPEAVEEMLGAPVIGIIPRADRQVLRGSMAKAR